MKKIMEQMAEELSAAFEKAGYDPSYGKVTVSNRPDLCEYQCNGAMAGAKAYHKAPFMIADDVVAQLSDSRIFSRKSTSTGGRTMTSSRKKREKRCTRRWSSLKRNGRCSGKILW